MSTAVWDRARWARNAALLDVKAGADRTTVTVRMILNGKHDGPAITTTVPSHSSQDIAPLFSCDEMPDGANVVGLEIESSAGGTSIGTRSLLVQAVDDN